MKCCLLALLIIVVPVTVTQQSALFYRLTKKICTSLDPWYKENGPNRININ